MAALVGPSVQLFGDQALHKPVHDGGPIFWHQENAYWQCDPATIVTCWVTLDDVDADNGALRVIPGSHREQVAHQLTFYSSRPSRTSRDRRALAFHYVTPGTTSSSRGAMPVTFRNPMVCFRG